MVKQRIVQKSSAFCCSMTPRLKQSLKIQSAIEARPVSSIFAAGMTEYLKHKKHRA